ncbi:hypothetical protein [uncultured Desulfovibrio sp.]|uniref:hypothetical protein n=1 Tax=uncultured Desulfovibrio sp. TaxID=167968 RepID=UPI002619E61A|nr:hypothetical protein [uncultured Desulfovibrio sp.]
MDPASGDLQVHMNCGARFVFGMGKGFCPGCDKEIREPYCTPLSHATRRTASPASVM